MSESESEIYVLYGNTFNIDQRAREAELLVKFPYKAHIVFSPPDFMRVAFVMLHGGSEVITLLGRDLTVLWEATMENEWPTHPRLLRIEVTGPGMEPRTYTRRDPWHSPSPAVAKGEPSCP